MLNLRVFFTHIRKFYITPYKESSSVTTVSKYQKWLTKTLILVFITVYCFYWFKAVNNGTENTKYILIWNPDDWYPFNTWKMGRKSFIEKRCPFNNCFIISRRNLHTTELRMFDAVAFNGRVLNGAQGLYDMPIARYDHQKYIYFNTESADNYPICHPSFDGFFNWTATYKLDSEIVYSYIAIKNGAGDEIGPKLDMKWPDKMSDISVANFNKTRAVAWFVSNCFTRSKREIYAKKLRNALKKYNLHVDVYGACGWLQCDRSLDCNKMLNNYYFYLSFENTFMEDYVTEKVLAPLQNNNVPIVYGGANYSRFLPPGSYLDARKLSPKKLAATIGHLIANPAEYDQYLRRMYNYIYTKPVHVCRLCAALNDDALMNKRQGYDELRRWWHPNYEERRKEPFETKSVKKVIELKSGNTVVPFSYIDDLFERDDNTVLSFFIS